MLRYDIERDLLDGKLAVRDLPDAWNQGMRDRLEVTPADDVEGCLQDIHWAHGAFGYFPSYAIGRASSPRSCSRACAPTLLTSTSSSRAAISARSPAGSPTHVHADGARLTSQELVKQATGKPLYRGGRAALPRGDDTSRRPDERTCEPWRRA